MVDNPLLHAKAPFTVANSLNDDSLQGKEKTFEAPPKVLTQIDYQEPVVTIRSVPRTHAEDNFLRTMDIIHREYLIYGGDIPLAASTYSFTPIVELMQRALPLRVMSIFRLFRFKRIKFKILTKSVPQIYGYLVVSRFPWVDAPYTGYFGFDSMWTAHPVVMSIGCQQSITIDLPWISAQTYHGTAKDFSQVAGLEVANMWQVYIRNLGLTRTDTSAPNTTRLDIFASFEGIELTRPDDPTKVLKGQMDRAAYLQEHYPGPEPAVASNSMVRSAVVAGTLATTSLPALQSTWNWLSNYAGTSKYERGIAQTVQQQGVWESTHGNSAMACNEGGGTTLDLFNDDHWIDPTHYGDTTLQHRLIDMCKIPQYVSHGELLLGDKISFECAPITFDDDLLINVNGYMAYLAQFFRRWRGSLKYMIMMTCSPFVTARVMVRVNFGADSSFSGADLGDYASHVITIKGDHNQTVVVPYIYNHPWQWCAQSLTTPLPLLELNLLSIDKVGDQEPVIKYIIWNAAGDDFIMDSYQFPNNIDSPKEERTVAAPKVLKGQMDMEKAFMAPFDPLPGFSQPENVPWGVTIEELLKRWSSRGSNISNFPEIFYQRVFELSGTYRGFTQCQNWDRLAHLFLYNSGSVRRRVFVDPTTTNPRFILSSLNWPDQAFDTNFESPCHGLAATSASKWSVIDFSVPFISTVEVDTAPDFYVISAEQAYVNPNTTNTSDKILDVWIKAGTNFQLFHRMPLPNLTWWPWYVEPPGGQPRPSARGKKGVL